jgi:hypothetical protein
MDSVKRLEADEDGNDLPAVTSKDVLDLIYLLEYARKRGFQIGPTVKIGEVTLQVRDTRLGEAPRGPEPTIWQEHGFDDGDK